LGPAVSRDARRDGRTLRAALGRPRRSQWCALQRDRPALAGRRTLAGGTQPASAGNRADPRQRTQSVAAAVSALRPPRRRWASRPNLPADRRRRPDVGWMTLFSSTVATAQRWTDEASSTLQS